VLTLAWEIASRLVQAVYYPPPSRVVAGALMRWMTSGGFSQDVLPSLARVLLAWALAGSCGIVVGAVMGLARRLAGFIEPLVHFLRAVPPPVILPIFLIFFGVGDAMKVLFIAFSIVWPVILNTAKGVRSVEPLQLEAAAVLSVRGMRRLRLIILPSALPEVLAGLRIALSLALVLMVISEMVAATGGIGFQVLQTQANFNIGGMWAAMMMLAAAGVVFNTLFMALERELLRWHPNVHNNP